ncbi:hypothetical protein ABFS83_01G075800 [Erythranthe nasuta]
MDSLTLSTTATATATRLSSVQLFSQPFLNSTKNSRIQTFPYPYRKPRKISVSASKDESKLDEWDQMELKFGRMIGEDPKLTLTKIMGKKLYPDMSNMEIEKLLEKKKGNWIQEIEEVPFDFGPSDKKNPTKESVPGLNLVRPVLKKGTKFEESIKPVEEDAKKNPTPPINLSEETKPAKPLQGLNLVRPVLNKGTKFQTSNKPVEEKARNSTAQSITEAAKETKTSVPNVILRKPSLFNDDDDGKYSMFGMKPNLTLKMGKVANRERFSDMTLLKKPEPRTVSEEPSDGKDVINDDVEGDKSLENGATLLQKPKLTKKLDLYEGKEDSTKEPTVESSSSDISTSGNLNQSKDAGENEYGSGIELQAPMSSMDTVLIGKPKRLERTVDKATDERIRDEVIPMNRRSLGNPLELENFITTSPIKEHEDEDWTRAEELVKTGERGDVELISSSSRGFVVSFGSLIGFIPYRNLAARWKFLAFESWLRRKGVDPTIYRQNLGIIGYEANSTTTDASESILDSEIGSKLEGAITSDMKLEELLMIYDQEKLKFLASFVGQKIRVGATLADRNSRRLIFTIKPKEKEELVGKKRSLMARLSVGDIVKCCITKITYFGVFVEVEGVPALIHQTEVSWDATLDPASYFKVGQIVEAKVHQLDFSLERIFLSLKEITPDPLIEALEAVVGDYESLDSRLETAQPDTEWDDVESLIKELEMYEGIQSVSKGRYFLSPGLAPTFQVYMASMFENQYKLLARAGNRVQEVIVQTSSLSKDELKSAIMTCTNRVG